MAMLKNLANALSITGTAIQAGVALNTTPFNGGFNKTTILVLDAPVGGAGVVKIQGSPLVQTTVPASGDVSWVDIVSLTSASLLQQEITMPNFIRTNITTLGTGTVTINLRGIQ